MFDFMFSNYRGNRLRQYDAKRQQEARVRGFLFSTEELAEILVFWGDLIQGAIAHTIDSLRFPLADGNSVEITPSRISFEKEIEPSAEAMRATVLHIAAQWEAKATLGIDEENTSTSREYRLRMRAYAEVYGIELTDQSDVYRDLAFTKAELARLPELRREIRVTHRDAPPERPDEHKQLADAYARRYPFRLPAA
jgi:hypothetical protein